MQVIDHQLQTLRVYKTLVDLREDWGGLLIFSCGPSAPRSGSAPAASIAGAASLLVAEDGHEVKKAFRRGEIDFVVNSLDEAIRALKNEVRKKRPLSVALVADVDATMREMMERGLRPDVEMNRAEETHVTTLVVFGETCAEYFIATGTPTELRDADARVLRMLTKDETVRRRWVERAGHYLRGAAGGRWLYLSESEAMLLESEELTVRSFDDEINHRLQQQSQPTEP